MFFHCTPPPRRRCASGPSRSWPPAFSSLAFSWLWRGCYGAHWRIAGRRRASPRLRAIYGIPGPKNIVFHDPPAPLFTWRGLYVLPSKCVKAYFGAYRYILSGPFPPQNNYLFMSKPDHIYIYTHTHIDDLHIKNAAPRLPVALVRPPGGMCSSTWLSGRQRSPVETHSAPVKRKRRCPPRNPQKKWGWVKIEP